MLYFGFGINRVVRRAQRLKGDRRRRIAPHGHAPDAAGPVGELETAIGRITGVGTEPGSVTAMLQWGDEAYPRMLEAIDAATTSIAMSSYIFRADELGLRFVEALARAHRRGVAVRVLIDGFGGGLLISPASRRLTAEGVPTARHLHSLLPWRMPLLNLRLHKKVLVLDGTSAFLGGLNIGAENLRSTNPAWPVCDTQFAIEGPVVRQIMASFRQDWAFATGEVLDGAEWFPADYGAGNAPARILASGPDQGFEQLALVLLSAINAARSTIRIVTPYFLPDEQLITALRLAVARGVAVDIIVPSIGDHRLVNWAMMAHVEPLLAAGCRVWRSAPPFDHSKLATIDEVWCLVGSANWDARSLRLNFEITMEFYDQDAVVRLNHLIDSKRGSVMTRDELEARWAPTKLRDAAARLLMPYL